MAGSTDSAPVEDEVSLDPAVYPQSVFDADHRVGMEDDMTVCVCDLGEPCQSHEDDPWADWQDEGGEGNGE